ncbi:hypothetical protein AA0116_g12912 [Alternaria tenuissima]|nr:hypothetical protein AA0116_g12912 [Alternaria tenuissima]
MCRRRITLYVDIVSPFAYIAFYILKNSKVFQQVELEFVPILLGGLMKICGNTPPLRIKNKDKWISTESQRLSKHFNVPISQDTPPGFPVNTLPIQRALVSLSLSHPQKVERAIELFYQNFWVQWNDPTKPETLQAILKTVLDSDEEARKAFEDGAFGLPWFVATNASGETEGYWGVDHIGELCEHLGLKRPFDTEWRSLL